MNEPWDLEQVIRPVFYLLNRLWQYGSYLPFKVCLSSKCTEAFYTKEKLCFYCHLFNLALSSKLKTVFSWVSKMAQWVKVLVVKPGDLNLI